VPNRWRRCVRDHAGEEAEWPLVPTQGHCHRLRISYHFHVPRHICQRRWWWRRRWPFECSEVDSVHLPCYSVHWHTARSIYRLSKILTYRFNISIKCEWNEAYYTIGRVYFKRICFMAVVDGVFCMDARVIYKTRDAVSRQIWATCNTSDTTMRDRRTV